MVGALTARSCHVYEEKGLRSEGLRSPCRQKRLGNNRDKVCLQCALGLRVSEARVGYVAYNYACVIADATSLSRMIEALCPMTPKAQTISLFSTSKFFKPCILKDLEQGFRVILAYVVASYYLTHQGR